MLGVEQHLALFNTINAYPKLPDAEFKDVFPQELPAQLPPPRAIDHAIETVPGSEPPSRPTYKMSLIELTELKKQLTDLMSKGFI